MTRRVIGAGIAVAVILAIAVTVILLLPRSGGTGGAAGPADQTASAQPTAVDTGRVSPELPEEPTLTSEQGAVQDASFGSCDASAGRQKVSGSITSTATERTDYVVTVSWINETSDVLARGVAVLKGVTPGESVDFTVSARVPKGASTCTYRVVRGRLAG